MITLGFDWINTFIELSTQPLDNERLVYYHAQRVPQFVGDARVYHLQHAGLTSYGLIGDLRTHVDEAENKARICALRALQWNLLELEPLEN